MPATRFPGRPHRRHTSPRQYWRAVLQFTVVVGAGATLVDVLASEGAGWTGLFTLATLGDAAARIVAAFAGGLVFAALTKGLPYSRVSDGMPPERAG